MPSMKITLHFMKITYVQEIQTKIANLETE